jgi:hypothetical protein
MLQKTPKNQALAGVLEEEIQNQKANVFIIAQTHLQVRVGRASNFAPQTIIG